MREHKERTYSRIRLGHHVTTFWCHHDSLAYPCTSGIVDRLQKASRYPCRPFYAWFIVELTIVVRWTVLNPVTLNSSQIIITCDATHARTFLPATVAYITRGEWFVCRLVLWSKRFASTTEARSTWISVDTCLTEGLKYHQFVSTIESHVGRTAEATPTATSFPASLPSLRFGPGTLQPSRLLRLHYH